MLRIHSPSVNVQRQQDGVTAETEFYNFVEVSGHNLESSQTRGFRIQCVHYKPVSIHFSQGEAGGVKSVGRVDCE